jgi:hypothetical protein
MMLLLGCDDQVWTAHNQQENCVKCHVGIEPIHPPQALQGVPECTFCHGGDPDAWTKEGAHVPVPDNYWDVRSPGDFGKVPEGFIKDMAPNQLDALDPAYVQFINPGDIRVLNNTCGACHPNHAATMPNSIMTTNAGHYMPSLYLAGFQDQGAIYGAHSASDPDCDPTDPGTSCELIPLEPPLLDDVQAAIDNDDHRLMEEQAYHHYLSKSCDTCHAAGYGKNNSPYLYRSSGCSACHVLYAPDGVYQGADPTIPNAPVYAATHTITKAIPTEQCTTCHFQGGRIGLLFRGIREGGFTGQDPPNAEFWNESVYDHQPGYYILDEDTTNDYDETPPDVHYEAGMHCADCHVGSDVHGDGRLYTTSKHQVDVRCEDCHGSETQARIADVSGIYRTISGRALPQLSTNQAGDVVLTGIVDGAEHIVQQTSALETETSTVHSTDGSGEAHETLTCDTCHTSYNLYCLGCHVNVDYRFEQRDQQTGLTSPGLVGGSRDTYMLDQVLLGMSPAGRIQSVVPSQQVQIRVYDTNGDLVLGHPQPNDDKDIGLFRVTDTSEANIGLAPFFQHTTSTKSRACSQCHRTEDSPSEWDRVRGVYGFGTGEFMLPNPATGVDVDPIQMIDGSGVELTDWVHIGTGPLPAETRDRALAIEVAP